MRSIVYIVNDNHFFLKMAVNSLRMLRKHNPDILVRVFWIQDGDQQTFHRSTTRLPGTSPKTAMMAFQDLGVEVIPKEPNSPELGYFFVNRTYLQEVPEESVLCLDSDTFVFGDLDRLFDKYPDVDVVANRADWAIDAGFPLDYLPLEPFNSGVILWNNGRCQEWARQLPTLMEKLRTDDGRLTDWLHKVHKGCYGREEFALTRLVYDQGLSYRYFDATDCVIPLYEHDLRLAGKSLIFHSYTPNWPTVHQRLSTRQFLRAGHKLAK